MDDHGYDQAACRRAAELLREEAGRFHDLSAKTVAHRMPLLRTAAALSDAAEWLEERA